MNKNTYIILILVCICLFTNVCAQNDISFDRLTTNDGLSQSDINCIYQDEQGYMWFGTHEGLNKYDGYQFKVYNPNPNNVGSINSNLIFDIEGDEKGNLWIATTGSGLNYFDRTTETFKAYMHDGKDGNSLINNHISKIHIDSKQRLWIATNKGINMLDLRSKESAKVFHKFNLSQEFASHGLDGKIIYDIYENDKNELFIVGTGGLFKLHENKNQELVFKVLNAELGLDNKIISCVIQDKLGRLVIGTSDGLYVQRKNSLDAKLIRLADGNYNNIVVDGDGNIWCGTNNGLLCFSSSTQSGFPRLVQRLRYNPLNENSLSKNVIKSLAIDHTGILWVGTNGGGINKYDPYKKQFRHIRKTLTENSLSYDKIRSMYEDSNGTLWIGTEGGGLNMLLKDDDDGTYSKFKIFETILKPFAIEEINRNGRKILLVGGENTTGLFQIDITNPKSVKEQDIKEINEITYSVFSLLSDKKENIWIGTYNGGIYRWLLDEEGTNYKKDILRNDPLNISSVSSNIIRDIFEDSNGNTWFATGDGLCKLTKDEAQKKNPKFKRFNNISGDVNSLSHNYILSMYEDANHNLWIGTFGGGLNKLELNATEEKFVSYTQTHGLPNNVIKGILEDGKGNLWLSTNAGLSKFNIKEKTFKNYDVHDGLQDNEFQELACLKRKNGEMLFGGINGFNVFYPENIFNNTFETETVITNFSIFNKNVSVGEKVNGRIILKEPINQTEKIELKHWENSFSFEFTSLHFASPQKNKFEYMLEGFDNNWIKTSTNKRFATYTNLSPGEYVLKVKASNNDGVWDNSPAELKVEVIPPFWLTGSAYFLYSLFLLGLLFAYRRFTIIKTTKKHQLELEHIEKEKYEEINKMKLEFFTNISHELRTPLTLIKGPLEYLQGKYKELDDNVISEQFNLMHKNSDYLLRLVNQLLDFRKVGKGKMKLVVRQGDIVQFIKEIGEPFQFLSMKRKIDFKVEESDTLNKAWFDSDAIEKIINNLLSNAFKFTPENGKISIHINKGDAYLKTKGYKRGGNLKDFVVIQVNDSGTGIPEDKLPFIFERFYVEKNRVKRNSEGIGIGLSFTKNLIELHQGQIEVISEQGKGTSFIVKLPIHKNAYENKPNISCVDSSEKDEFIHNGIIDALIYKGDDELVERNIYHSRSKLPVLLVVDDNSDIRSFIKRAMGEKYEVYEAENGKEGVEIAVKIIPNIILADVMMPVMDGFEFCSKIKNTQETSHIPVVMLTAKSSQESEMEGLTVGADDYLRKPFDIEVLKLKLNNIINHRKELRKRFNREVSLQPKEVTVTSADEQFLQQAIAIVEKHMMDTSFNVEVLLKEMGFSRTNMYLKFKELTDLSSSEFIRNIRLKRAMQLLENSDMSVKEIMYQTGFNTASYFAKCFKKQFGVLPSEYVRQIHQNR